MRIIKVPFLAEASRRYPKAGKWIENWCAITRLARWPHLQEVRHAYPSADAVTVKSGRTVTVFNVCGNDYRLLTAIHYNRGIVYTLRFMTHAEYSKNKWKNDMKTKLNITNLPKNYQALLGFQMLRPIRDKIDYTNAVDILGAMAGHVLTSDQEDYFEALSLLVEAYEAAHLPGLPAKKGLSLLKHLVEENNLSAADLSRLLGADRSLGVRILNEERNLTVDHIKKLAAHFHVPGQVFLS